MSELWFWLPIVIIFGLPTALFVISAVLNILGWSIAGVVGTIGHLFGWRRKSPASILRVDNHSGWAIGQPLWEVKSMTCQPLENRIWLAIEIKAPMTTGRETFVESYLGPGEIWAFLKLISGVVLQAEVYLPAPWRP
ncbi:MAG: hypothetical protein Q8P22_06630 [Chloroflexota bacterium]|nr:hypothetical protein [Chloroflexota bacterium]